MKRKLKKPISDYERAWNFYREQLRRYKQARPDWRSIRMRGFWENFGHW